MRLLRGDTNASSRKVAKLAKGTRYHPRIYVRKGIQSATDAVSPVERLAGGWSLSQDALPVTIPESRFAIGPDPSKPRELELESGAITDLSEMVSTADGRTVARWKRIIAANAWIANRHRRESWG
jgi:hypothetical protein